MKKRGRALRRRYGRADLSPEAYRRAVMEREKIIRENRARRMRSGPRQAPLPVPERPKQPMKVQLETADGEYIGTWPWGVSEADAIEEARGHGYKGRLKVNWVPA